MGQTLAADAGYDRFIGLALRNKGVPTPYPSDAVLDAEVWAGDDQGILFSPTASWIDAETAATLKLWITAAQSSAVEPGTYKLKVGVTSGGIRSLAFDGHLAIEGGPGTGTPRKVYGSFDDVLLWSDQAELLQNIDTSQAGLREERAEARDIMIRQWVENYRPRGGFIRVRGTTWNHIYGFDRPDASRIPPTRDQLEAWLLDDRLVVDEGARKIASFLAIAILYDRQETKDDNPYRARAYELRDTAMEMLGCYRLRLDTTTSPDGVADLEIQPGNTVVYLGGGS